MRLDGLRRCCMFTMINHSIQSDDCCPKSNSFMHDFSPHGSSIGLKGSHLGSLNDDQHDYDALRSCV